MNGTQAAEAAVIAKKSRRVDFDIIRYTSLVGYRYNT
jgi:hypothetical protein